MSLKSSYLEEVKFSLPLYAGIAVGGAIADYVCTQLDHLCGYPTRESVSFRDTTVFCIVIGSAVQPIFNHLFKKVCEQLDCDPI